MPRSSAITLQDLTLAYDGHAAVHHFSGSFDAGSMTAIVGPNGAGKSTLLKAIVGEKTISSGKVITGERCALAYLPQVAEIDRSFPLAVSDVVLLGAWRKHGAFRSVTAETRQRAAAALEMVGLASFGKRPIAQLSFGQFRRVLFARLLVQDADVILLDEPFAAVDERTEADLMGLLHRWHDENRTVVAVLHDIDQVRSNFPQTLLMARELIAWGMTDPTLSDSNLRRARKMSQDWEEASDVCSVPPARVPGAKELARSTPAKLDQ